MRAAVLKEYGEPLVVEDREKPQASDEGVVVDVDACGICRSDWHAWHGDWPTPTDQVLGHEPAGTVVETGPEVEHIREGDEVAIPFNLADGSCSRCHADRSHMCENGRSLGFEPSVPGAFAEEVHVPHAEFNLAHLPEGASATGMAGLGCRFMTAYHALVHRTDASVGDSVAVHGCGGIGLSTVHIADAMGLDVVAVDINEDPLERARSLGADETVDASDAADVGEAVTALTDGGADYAVDALGAPETCRNAIQSLGTFGTHVQIGLTPGDGEGVVGLPVDLTVREELEFVGSKGMQPSRYDELVRMVERGRLDPTKVVSRTVSLEDAGGVLQAMTNYENDGIAVITEF